MDSRLHGIDFVYPFAPHETHSEKPHRGLLPWLFSYKYYPENPLAQNPVIDKDHDY